MSAINLMIRIDAPIDAVFGALTTNEAIAGWFTETVCAKWAIDEQATWFGETVMRILDLSKNQRVALRVLRGGGWDKTEIAFSVEALSKTRTMVRFDHTDWPEVDDHFRDCAMSWAYFLESLRLYVETGVGTPEGVAPACEAG